MSGRLVVVTGREEYIEKLSLSLAILSRLYPFSSHFLSPSPLRLRLTFFSSFGIYIQSSGA